ncbi:MAG: SpoIIE family protein phosphatase [Acidobacteria bacterium]|nr:SpoIIE family protein phosphatase [Acidobacteriota bacterium]
MADCYNILLIGINAGEEDSARAHLTRSGHRIWTAADIDRAKKPISEQPIDIVYLKAEEEDGALGRLKQKTGLKPSLPVVIVSDSATKNTILDAWREGAADVLSAPLTPDSLSASLRRLAQRLPSRRENPASPVTALIFYLDESGKENRVDISPPRMTLGRSGGNDLILSQRGVSRCHAEVLVEDGEYFLHDLDSKMGTFLNGVRIQQARLTDGDRIQLGGPQGTSLSFHKGDLLQSLLSLSDPRAETGLSLYGFKEVGKLFKALRALSSIAVLDDLLALVVDTAIELTGAERGVIMLKEQSGELVFRCARDNNKHSLDGSCFRTSKRVPQDVFRTGRPVIIKDLDFDQANEGHDSTRQLGLRSISCVPLRYITARDNFGTSTVGPAESIGVLYVDSPNIGSKMSETRIDALETLASEAAMAIFNARLYKDSQDKRRFDEQLAIAKEIQQALLPQPTRNLEFIRACSRSLPCYSIGGDYFDYFELENGDFGFAVGDVAGKGMPAAILASLVQGMFAAQNFLDAPIPAIIGGVNRELVQRGTGSRFVTFFLGMLDSEGNCIYVNAGHNAPLLVSRDGSMKELQTGGTVLGLFADAAYEQGSVRMQPGDHLVLFTDGVIEALNSSQEEYGLPRLVDLLRSNARSNAAVILSRLEESVLSFSANAPQHDDITMMVLGYREQPA